MTRPIRAFLALVATLAFVFTLAGGGGTASLGERSQAHTETDRVADARPRPSRRSRPGCAPVSAPRITASRRSPRPPGGSTRPSSMAARFPGSAREQLAVVVEVAGGSGRTAAGRTSCSPPPGPGRTSLRRHRSLRVDVRRVRRRRRQGLAPGRAGQVRRADAHRPPVPAVRPPPERHRLRRRRRVVPQGPRSLRQADHGRRSRRRGSPRSAVDHADRPRPREALAAREDATDLP